VATRAAKDTHKIQTHGTREESAENTRGKDIERAARATKAQHAKPQSKTAAAPKAAGAWGETGRTAHLNRDEETDEKRV